MDSVVDFLVLESLYKTSVCTQWQEGDRFCSHIDEEFWFGSVKEKRAFRWVFSNTAKLIQPLAHQKMVDTCISKRLH